MPTRTVKLKMVLPRSERGRPVRCELWTTHAIVNDAVKRIEEVLLLCRGDTYVDSAGEVHGRDKVRSGAVEYAHIVQEKNGRLRDGSDEQILVLLRKLYERIVESAVTPNTGNAQQSRGFVRTLMDSASQGGRHAAKKVLDAMPAWVEMMRKAEPDWEANPTEWLHSDGVGLLNATGAPPRWVRLHRGGKPWQKAFLAHQERLRTQVTGDPLEPLRAIG